MNVNDIEKLMDLLNKTNIKNIFTYENHCFELNKLYKIGYIKRKQNKLLLETIFEHKYFEMKEDTKKLDEGDLILAKVIFNPRGKIKLKYEAILEETKNNLLLYLLDGNLLNFKTQTIRKIDGFNKNKYKEYDLFLLNENKLDYLGNLNDPKVDDIISLYSFKQEFRLEEYKYELHEKEEKIDFKSRVDLSNLDFCTIDPKTAKDHDDAIYYDEHNNILYVAIADVSSYVKEGSKLDKEAYKRSFSSYFPNKVYPMLPFSLSAGICSLKPNVLRHAFVCKIYFDKNYVVEKSDFFEAVIESKNNFSYEYIDECIEKKVLPFHLERLLKITLNLREKRLENGFDFRNTEVSLILDKEENLLGYHQEENSQSHHLVEECMLLANQEAAKKLENKGIFRVHEEPDIKKIDSLIDALKEFGLKIKKKINIHTTINQMQKSAERIGLEAEVDKLIIESQQQARYSFIKSNHFGLGFKHYSHFTSPIRRYSDLVLHRILKSGIIPDNIEQICEDISQREREISRMVWDLEDRKYSRWAETKIDKSYNALIVDNTEEPKIELTEGMLGLRAIIVNYAGEKLFAKVYIKILSSNILNKKIECKIISR